MLHVMAVDRSELLRKVHDIFVQLPGARMNGVDPGTVSDYGAIAEAIAGEFGPELAQQIAFHLTDWTSDAAFLVAAALFPGRFTAEEMRAGVLWMIVHAPNHVAAAAKLAGYPIRDIFNVGPLNEDSEP